MSGIRSLKAGTAAPVCANSMEGSSVMMKMKALHVIEQLLTLNLAKYKILITITLG